MQGRKAGEPPFGATCGIDPQVNDDRRLAAAGPLLQLLGQLLSMVLAADRARERATLLAVEAELAAETDAPDEWIAGVYAELRREAGQAAASRGCAVTV